jgi:3-oxoadipate enol-lactonase
MVEAATPPLPPGRSVELPGRGTTFVREVTGPPGAPTIVLLHGWTATADLNWFTSYAALGRRFHVAALDHRGHGKGIRSRRPFRLEDCADDVAALADVLGRRQVIVAGYSMGGPIAQLVWRRHPDLVQGMVLCATARSFRGTREERIAAMGLGGLAVASRVTPKQAQRWLSDQFIERRRETKGYEAWAVSQIQGHDWTALLEAGQAIGRFSSREWIGSVDVPTAVVVTMRDTVVPVRRQVRLFESIPGATAYRVDGDHGVCAREPQRFVPTFVTACTTVAERVRVQQQRGA